MWMVGTYTGTKEGGLIKAKPVKLKVTGSALFQFSWRVLSEPFLSGTIYAGCDKVLPLILACLVGCLFSSYRPT